MVICSPHTFPVPCRAPLLLDITESDTRELIPYYLAGPATRADFEAYIFAHRGEAAAVDARAWLDLPDHDDLHFYFVGLD